MFGERNDDESQLRFQAVAVAVTRRHAATSERLCNEKFFMVTANEK